jgi:hypothetical protein
MVSGLAALLTVPALAGRAPAAVRRQTPGGGSSPGSAAEPIPRQNHAATTLPSGLVLITGGYWLGPLSSAQLLDPTDGSWFDVRPMNVPRYYHMSALLPNGQVLVSGGLYQDVLSDAEVYDPNKDIWMPVAPMNLPRSQHSGATISGGVLVTGGIFLQPLTVAEYFDGNTWHLIVNH